MLSIAYLSDTTPVKKVQKETAQQRLHRLAVAALAARKIADRQAALKKHEPRRAAIQQLRAELEKLSNVKH